MKIIRYSQAFKREVVRKVECGRVSAIEVQRKYNITGNGTVTRWVRQFGRGKYGKVIRMEEPDEMSQSNQLRSELRRAKEALADAQMELALEKAYLAVACEQMNQSVERFKKKQAGGRHTKRSKPTRN